MARWIQLVADLLSGRVNNTLLNLRRDLRKVQEEVDPLQRRVRSLTLENRQIMTRIKEQEAQLGQSLTAIGVGIAALTMLMTAGFEALKAENASLKDQLAQQGADIPDLSDEIQTANAAVEQLNTLAQTLQSGSTEEAVQVVVDSPEVPTVTTDESGAVVIEQPSEPVAEAPSEEVVESSGQAFEGNETEAVESEDEATTDSVTTD